VFGGVERTRKLPKVGPVWGTACDRQCWDFFEYAPWDLNPEPTDQEQRQAGFELYRVVPKNGV